MTNNKITEDGELPVSQPKGVSQPTNVLQPEGVSPAVDAITATKIFQDAANNIMASYKASYGSLRGTSMEEAIEGADVSKSRLVRLRINAPDDVELHGKYVKKKVQGFWDQPEVYAYLYQFVDRAKAMKMYTERASNNRSVNIARRELITSFDAAGLTNVSIELEPADENVNTNTNGDWVIHDPEVWQKTNK